MPGVEISRRPLDFSGGSRSHLRSLARLSGRGPAHDEPELPDDTGRPRSAAPAPPNGCPASPLQRPRAELLVRGFFQRVCSISALIPLFFYGGPRPRRPMRHHRQVHRFHQHPAARRCRAHRRGGPDHRGLAPGRRRFQTGGKRRASRIAPSAIREPRGREGAGQGASPAVSRDPDCRGRLAVKLLRLLGGRR